MKRNCLGLVCRAMEVRRGLFGAALVAAALSLSACVSKPEGIPTTSAVEQEDIPVPTNFEFDEARSYAFDPPGLVPEGRFRSWCGYYKGDGTIGLIVPWYVTEMRKYGWQLTGHDDKTNKLMFEKGDEAADIVVSSELDGGRGKYVRIVKVQVRPKGPEDFTVDENLGRVQDSNIKPASYPAGAGTPGTANPAGSEPGQVVPAIPEAGVLDEIEGDDARRSEAATGPSDAREQEIGEIEKS